MNEWNKVFEEKLSNLKSKHGDVLLLVIIMKVLPYFIYNQQLSYTSRWKTETPEVLFFSQESGVNMSLKFHRAFRISLTQFPKSHISFYFFLMHFEYPQTTRISLKSCLKYPPKSWNLCSSLNVCPRNGFDISTIILYRRYCQL